MNQLFNLGLNDMNAGKQLITTEQAIIKVAEICGDCTITPCYGVYTYDDGHTEIENSLKIECYCMSETQGRLKARELAIAFNQQSVVRTTFISEGEFIRQD